MSKTKTTRLCKDCNNTIPFKPRQVRRIDCYKKHTNWTKPTEEAKFIDEDD